VLLRGIPVARLLGTEIRVHVSWTLIAAFLVASLGAVDLPGRYPSWPAGVAWAVAVAAGAGFFASVLVHELAHLAVARRANAAPPSVTLLLFGGVAPAERGARSAAWEAAIAIAGPVASIAIGSAALGAAAAIGAPPATGVAAEALVEALAVVGLLSWFVGLVNLAPVFPLDGSRLLRALAWQLTGEEGRGTRVAGMAGRLLGVGLMGAGVLLAFSGDLVAGFVVGVLGWFVRGSSGVQARQEVLEGLIADATVGDAMERDLPAVPPQVTLDTFAAVLSGPDSPSLVRVMAGDRLVGLVGRRELRHAGRSAWQRTQAAVAMLPADSIPTAAPGDGLRPAAARLQAAGVDGLPVIDDGRLVGILTRHGIGRLVHARSLQARPPR
jgi:Zn-dependent protease/predicted transcriptional regulator